LRSGRHAHTLNPHIGCTDGKASLDQRVDDLHSPAELSDLTTASRREELLLLIADRHPSLILSVHAFEFADVLGRLFKPEVSVLSLSTEASILGDVDTLIATI